jgi:hypothetical protein
MQFVFMPYNGLCKWSAGLKVMNFQARTEPIRLIVFSFLRQSSKTNWRCCNNQPQLDYPLKPALHLHFVRLR